MKTKRKRSHLVSQHVEQMSGRIFEAHPEVVREYVKGRRGIYALYKRAKLYYVGLATDLRSRLKAHLKDRHAGAWDNFSLYLTETSENLRELEALAIRIALPLGNRTKTKFAGSRDLRRCLKRRITEEHVAATRAIFGVASSLKKARSKGREKSSELELAGLLQRRTPLRMTYKGTTHTAVAYVDGRIKLKGKIYESPTSAARSIMKKPVNGWWAWKFEAVPGDWQKLKTLR